MLDWKDDNDYFEYKKFQRDYKNEPVHISGGFSIFRTVLVIIGIVASCISPGLGIFYFACYLSLRLSGMI